MNAPPPIAPILAPAGNFQGNSMDRIYAYILNGLIDPNNNDLVFFPQVVTQIEANLNNHPNAQQQYRLNNLRNRYQILVNQNNMINDNMMVGFGRRRSHVKSASPSKKKKRSPKKSPKKSRRNSKLRTVMKSIERRLNKIRSQTRSKKIRSTKKSPKSKKSSRKSRSRK